MQIMNELILENGHRHYELTLANGKLTGETWVIDNPQAPISPANSFFKSIVQQYKSSD
ncbi:hypothetical protein [Brevibacillus laterosporus]|uniref:Uncharacterized protein n=1 Tax=Brevibacillus laterosporus TaxID=1465 RepID=A0AAP3DBY8_BRELA|nr:hypothetical protein [Brevibacillus laterosporus]MCR8978409.1 hypothetical protein [Brevibacillus laterosporus]MCZ0805564.1 hypothetical protein [Brevibacillus laterosporus]MCZ0825286.1 hypothetical protein [Brevibacillus laterosporus]MCZ0849062.1 hypothetical protein [Brevibacillus laterosporus]MED1663368.1 hypothetical protein [Brevibacillus laterosporus]